MVDSESILSAIVAARQQCPEARPRVHTETPAPPREHGVEPEWARGSTVLCHSKTRHFLRSRQRVQLHILVPPRPADPGVPVVRDGRPDPQEEWETRHTLPTGGGSPRSQVRDAGPHVGAAGEGDRQGDSCRTEGLPEGEQPGGHWRGRGGRGVWSNAPDRH